MSAHDIYLAPSIYRTPYGYRVYIRIAADPRTGRGSRKKPHRFKFDGRSDAEWVPELKAFRDRAQLNARTQRLEARRQAGPSSAPASTLTADIATYLALDTVKAMPSYHTRVSELEKWKLAFGDRDRHSLDPERDLNEQLQRWLNEGIAASTVNKYRCALMSLFTKLDGKGKANPVKASELFEERAIEAQGFPPTFWTPILKVVTSDKSRARLDVLLWTGIEPKQLGRMKPHHINLTGSAYTNPLRSKGRRTVRTPRAIIQKHMLYAETKRAFQHFVEANAFGRFSAHSLRMVLIRAAARVEQKRQKKDPGFVMPHVTLKLLRHSLATKVSEDTKGNLELVGQLIDHARGSKQTLRYALGAVTRVMQQHARTIAGRTRKRRGRAA